MTACPACGETSDAGASLCPSCGVPLESPERRIGPYRLLRRLGEGGMGVVYEAEQQNPRRLVALKVVHGGNLVARHQLKLFQREVQALARLRHPGVAAIYEAGCTGDGQHFFAMELVRGETLAAWVSRRRADTAHPLTLKELLGLFLQVCEAVSYAHQRAVLHRDLKPSNVLVTEGSGDGSSPGIKMLDFGLARITDADVAATTVVSEAGRIQGTLLYMSPEQVRGNPDEIDLRSDVYSLGVILYELLAESLPYQVPAGAPLHTVVRAITEDSPRPLPRSVDRDLVTIVSKALEKEPSRRYQGVPELSGDVERYLGNQPILARPPSAGYQLRKLVARHRTGAGFAAALLVLAAGSGVAIGVQSRRVARERDRALAAEATAKTEAETLQRVTAFMVDLFKVSDPSEALGNTITAREVLDKGAARIGTELQDQPLVQAALQEALGRVYGRLGLLQPGRRLLESALATRRRLYGDDSLEVAANLHAFEDVIPSSEVQFERSSPAEAYAREALAIRRRLLGEPHLDVAASLLRLGMVLAIKGNHLRSTEMVTEGERLVGQGLAMRRRLLGSTHWLVADALQKLGFLTTWARWDVEAGQPLLQEAVSLERRVLGDTHPETLKALENLANCYSFKGDAAAAETAYREVLEGRRATLGDRHSLVARTLYFLATVRARRDDLEDAERLLARALEISGGPLAESAAVDALMRDVLADVKRSQAQPAGAETLLRGLWVQSQKTPPGQPPFVGGAAYKLASLLAHEGRYAEAEAITREALGLLGSSNRAGRPASLLFQLAQLRDRRGDTAAAAALFQEAAASQRKALESLRQQRPLVWPQIAEAEWLLGAILEGLGQHEAAEPLLVGCLPSFSRWYGPRDYRTREVLDSIVQLYVRWGRPNEAAEYRALAAAARRPRVTRGARRVETGTAPDARPRSERSSAAHRSSTRSVISSLEGGFSASPRLCSISWMIRASPRAGFRACWNPNSRQTWTTRLPGAVTATTPRS